MKKVSNLNIHRGNIPSDMQEVIESFREDDKRTGGLSYRGLFKYVQHSHRDIEDDELITVIGLMNNAIEILSLSVDYSTTAVDTVHYIISQDEKRLVIYIEMVGDELSRIVIPRFIGNKFSNIEALRRISTNLSGQFNIKTRLYI